MNESRFEEIDPAVYVLPDATRTRALTPALVVVLDRVRENVRRMLAYTEGPDRWRPHVKTTKIPEVWAELVRSGVRKFKCATTREARFLLEVLDDDSLSGTDGPGGDLLVAYPLMGPALAALGDLARRHPKTRVSVLCESPDVVRDVPPDVSIFVDVNPGMHRTGIPVADRAAIHEVARVAGDRLRGVHYYDGHLHDTDIAKRRREIFACYDALIELAGGLARAGHRFEEITTSGTPSFRHALAYPAFRELAGVSHRVSPGTVVFHDLRSERENPDLDLVPAAYVMTRVISRPAPDIVTCDAGSKSIAAESGDPCAFVLGHPELVPMTPSEEHLPLRVETGARPELGDVLCLIPHHVCPTVNLAEQAWLVDGDDARVVSVRARAHDMTFG